MARKITKTQNLTKKNLMDTFLFEAAWEVCNQVGGIYTVIRSKIPSVISKWGYENYCLLGPYIYEQVAAEFDPITDYDDEIGRTVEVMRQSGYDIHYGHWLVSGRPRVVLFNPFTIKYKIDLIKYELWEHNSISTPGGDELLDNTLAFGYQIKEFFKILTGLKTSTKTILAHFHEWMAGSPIPGIRYENIPVRTVFTTHATLLGRYLAMNSPSFYGDLPFFDWAKEAKHFNIEAQVNIERAAAHGANVFTTVSDVTALECKYLLGRQPEIILPNGLNITRYEAVHKFQNLHVTYKEKIHEFVMGHFFPNYSFDLEQTLYFFTSGRFEYQNKGFDLTLEALARLNWKMKEAKMNQTVITFFITKRPFHSINSNVLQSRAVMEEINRICTDIQNQVGEKLFYSITASTTYKLPDLNQLVSDHLRLKLRRTIQSWKSNGMPSVVTHNIYDDATDPLLGFLRVSGLINKPDDKVKIVYHPDFLSPSNPLFRLEYGQFVRGCHLGLFPSYYEPWGYTPLECLASGIPAITSDLAGFGDYVIKNVPDYEEKGIYVVNRRYKSFNDAAEQMANTMFGIVQQTRRERIARRNNTEASSVGFDWNELRVFYDMAYKMALNND